ncbi:MAG: hypothetical protein H6709_07210 [Kofleriaceae bacterium]|nr:hypothetical protein [Myxococcales bacterium]MCB9560080.1 hypothetical protein [Kofleriaceae bacterium]MCB9571867.1 hypothetical protein [Kofleriaceae bacterium]
MSRPARHPATSLDPSPVAATAPPSSPGAAATAPTRACPVDLSITCPTCDTAMQPEHAHYRCLRCGYRDSCCF